MSEISQDAVESPARLSELSATAQKVYAQSLVAGFEQVRRTYEQAQQVYAQDLQTLHAELSERTQQAYKAYVEAQATAYFAAPSYEPCLSEYRGYLEHLQQLTSGAQALQGQKEAYDRYVQQLAEDASHAGQATQTYQQELSEVWKQQPLRDELEAAQNRYVEQLRRLSEDARSRQEQAWRDLLQHLDGIWSQPEIAARTQAALGRLTDAARDALIACHAAVETSSAKAIEALNA